MEGADDGPEVLFRDELVVVKGLNGVSGEDLVELGELGEHATAVLGLQAIELDILIDATDPVCLLPQRDRGVVAQRTNLLGTLLPVGSLTLSDHGLRPLWV